MKRGPTQYSQRVTASCWQFTLHGIAPLALFDLQVIRILTYWQYQALTGLLQRGHIFVNLVKYSAVVAIPARVCWCMSHSSQVKPSCHAI